MDEPRHATANTRVAIECLTIWLEEDRETAATHIANIQNSPDGPGATGIISGFLSLSELLVLNLAASRRRRKYTTEGRRHSPGMVPTTARVDQPHSREPRYP
jgi:hypothetical protein